MHPLKFHYEVLLFTGTSLAGRQLGVADGTNQHEPAPGIQDRLELACRKGLMEGWLAVECRGNGLLGRNGYIRDIQVAVHFLHIQMGLGNPRLNEETSIDPHYFMRSINSN